MPKQGQLDELSAQILADKICPDLAAQATQLVFGAGNADADMVFVGEAPGKNEDVQGKPFVGAAGKLLNEMLATIRLTREDVYITNIVKYRPPNNRDPLPEEKAAFLPYLQKQINIIKPKLIVTLGRHSMNSLLPSLKISEAHGQPKRIKLRLNSEGLVDSSWESSVDETTYQPLTTNYLETVVLPLYHPAAALYNGGLRQTLFNDFAAIPAILKKL